MFFLKSDANILPADDFLRSLLMLITRYNGVDQRWKAIIDHLAKEWECEILELAGMPEPVPMLGEVDPPFGVHRFVKRVTGLRSRLLRRSFPSGMTGKISRSTMPVTSTARGREDRSGPVPISTIGTR